MSANPQSPAAGGSAKKPMIKRIRREIRRAALKVFPRLKGNAGALAAELARLTQEREELEFQLYLLRSTHQKTVARNDELLAEVRHLRANGVVETCYARLAAQLTMSSYEISSLLRAALPDRSANSGGDSRRYLDLLEKALTGQLFEDAPISPWTDQYDPAVRMIGRDWPGRAQTMIGAARMRNIRDLSERVIDEGVPGDFLEAGVWRGGACIYMRGILAARGETERQVWVADSFAGLPPPDPETYPADHGDTHHQVRQLIVPLDEVKEIFARYGLLDEQVRFLPGGFAETLSQAPIAQLAILRLDGDMYSSTIQTLDALYDKVTLGGYVIIDDYILKACRRATDDFRAHREIADPIQDIDGAGVYWRKIR